MRREIELTKDNGVFSFCLCTFDRCGIIRSRKCVSRISVVDLDPTEAMSVIGSELWRLEEAYQTFEWIEAEREAEREDEIYRLEDDLLKERKSNKWPSKYK